MNTNQGLHQSAALHALTRSATLGFGTCVAMWVVAFAAHLPAIAGEANVLRVAPLLLVQLAGAVIAGRSAAGAGLGGVIWAGGLAGGLTGALNLLILGSVIADPQEGGTGMIPGAVGFTAGYLVLSVVLGGLGGFLGSTLSGGRAGPDRTDSSIWLARFGVVTCAAILPLLFVGGLVTSTASGMAFPDWPTSDGRAMFLYPLSLMTGDHKRFYEHSHRLFGALVGVTAFAQLVLALVVERRAWVKGAAAAFFGLVVVQGLLGAGRVAADSPAMGMVHGILGQLTFGAAVALAAVFTARFRDQATPGAATVRVSTTVWLLAALVLQLALGAAYRHLGHKHVIYTHAAAALLPTIFAAIVAFAARRGKAGNPSERLLARIGTGLLHATNLQWLLGLAALVVVVLYPDRTNPHALRAVFGTLHQFNGALILALAVLAWVWAMRLGRATAAKGVRSGAQ